MKVLIFSYIHGMFGEFLSSQISNSSSKFYNQGETLQSENNQYIVTNYLSPINRSMKHHRVEPADKFMKFTNDERKILEDYYEEKHICLPTHWFGNLKMINLPCYGIRLRCSDPLICNLSCILFYLKTFNRFTKDPDSIEYWKNQSQYFFKTTDLKTWIQSSYQLNFFYNQSLYEDCTDWNILDAGNIVYNNMKDLDKLESIIEGTMDRVEIQGYAERNLKLLKDKLGLTLDDLSGTQWLDLLYDWCKNQLNE